jgi:hypothetical protein
MVQKQKSDMFLLFNFTDKSSEVRFYFSVRDNEDVWAYHVLFFCLLLQLSRVSWSMVSFNLMGMISKKRAPFIRRRRIGKKT